MYEYSRTCVQRPPVLAIKIFGHMFGDFFNCTDIWDLLPGICCPRLVVSHGSGLSLYLKWSLIVYCCQLHPISRSCFQANLASECAVDTLLGNLRRLLDNPEYSDLNIRTGDGRTVHCHRAIVALRCPALLQVNVICWQIRRKEKLIEIFICSVCSRDVVAL